MNKISVVIPFYKYKNYLKECLDYLEQSTFQDFETILVLDPESEDISSLLEAYPQVRVIQSPNAGVAACRNVGVKEARGEYIYFLDEDDYVLDDTLSLLAAKIAGQDIIYGKVENTWNNKLNFLDKKAKKQIDPDLEEERELRKQERISNYKQNLPSDTNWNQALAVYWLLARKKGLRNVTVLGNLYRTDKIKNYPFHESFRYYSDITCLIPFLDSVTTAYRAEEAIYVKRKHNDPINYPALRQEENDNRFEERCQAVEYTRTLVEPSSLVRFYLDQKIIQYYTKNMTKAIRRSQDDVWRTQYFERIRPVIENCEPSVIDSLNRKNKKLVEALLASDLNKVQRQTRWILGKKKFKSMVKNKNTAYKLAYYHRYLKMDVNPKVILFESFMAKNYSDSPKYIYEYIAKNYPEFTCVWAINDDAEVPFGAKKIKRFSFQYAYYLATAKYLVFNVRPPLWYRKREEQVFLETWHGTPLKRLVFDQEEVTSASPKYKEQFYKQRKDWDYLVSANPFSTETFRRCFMYDGKMLEYGYPRNDILYDEHKEALADSIRTKLNIPKDKKTILYAPTWRDDEIIEKGKYSFTLALDLNLLKERLSDEYVVLLRTHHYVAEHIDVSGMEDFVFNVCTYDDISELYLISDICITDYSSVFFDYANLRRPILFYTYDIDKYKNQLRGFYIDMETEIPGPLLYTSEEVVQAIENIDQVNEQYKERYDAFYDRFCCYDDGHASENVAEEVLFGKKKG